MRELFPVPVSPKISMFGSIGPSGTVDGTCVIWEALGTRADVATLVSMAGAGGIWAIPGRPSELGCAFFVAIPAGNWIIEIVCPATGRWGVVALRLDGANLVLGSKSGGVATGVVDLAALWA